MFYIKQNRKQQMLNPTLIRETYYCCQINNSPRVGKELQKLKPRFSSALVESLKPETTSSGVASSASFLTRIAGALPLHYSGEQKYALHSTNIRGMRKEKRKNYFPSLMRKKNHRWRNTHHHKSAPTQPSESFAEKPHSAI